MTWLDGFLSVFLPSSLWLASLGYLARAGLLDARPTVAEFVGAPLWALLVLVGDVTYWLEYGGWPS
jgi:hypothetical protein